jgi:7-cyano-7-deazaguanosine (preQ0) biosynthesis protein QueE
MTLVFCRNAAMSRLTTLCSRTVPLDLQRDRPIAGKVDADKLQLVEIFDSLQGEGPDIGLPARFVRVAHCNRRCAWCDTDYRQRYELSAPDFVQGMLEDYTAAGPTEDLLVIFTGGEPTLQAANLNTAILQLQQHNQYRWRWSCESNGTLLSRPEVVDFYRLMHRIVISPKPPSSQNPAFDWPDFWRRIIGAALVGNLVIKPVIMDDADLAWFKAAAEEPARPLEVPFVMQTYVDPDPGSAAMADFRGYWRTLLTAEFIGWMRRYNVRLLPRLHNLIWGNQQGY